MLLPVGHGLCSSVYKAPMHGARIMEREGGVGRRKRKQAVGLEDERDRDDDTVEAGAYRSRATKAGGDGKRRR